MTLSMYQASVPRLVAILENLSAILDKAQAHIDARKVDVAVLMGARLALDMYPFSKQVQIACDKARSVVARLAGMGTTRSMRPFGSMRSTQAPSQRALQMKPCASTVAPSG